SIGFAADQEPDASTVKVALLARLVPAGLVTVSLPVDAPSGTVTVSCVALIACTFVWPTPPKGTFVAVERVVPVRVTGKPAWECAGVNEVTVGGSTTVKLPVLVPEPDGVVTATLPVVAVAGTVAVIWVALSTVNCVATPLNVTFVASVKLVP